MEVRAIGSIEDCQLQNLLQLLTGLAGHEPSPINMHEIVMRCEGARRQEVSLRHIMIPADGHYPAADRWVAVQYNRPPWSYLEMAKLAATVLTVSKATCSGPDVPGFWKGLGFLPKFEHYKRGHTFDVIHSGKAVHLLVSRLHKAVQRDNGTVQVAEEVVAGHVLVEAWTEADTENYKEAIAAVQAVGKYLEPLGVSLQQLPGFNQKPGAG